MKITCIMETLYFIELLKNSNMQNNVFRRSSSFISEVPQSIFKLLVTRSYAGIEKLLSQKFFTKEYVNLRIIIYYILSH